MSFNYEVRTIHWEKLKAVRESVMEIAREVRKDYRRKSKHIVSVIAHRPITHILSPLSLLFHHRYSDEATIGLIEAAVCRLNTLAARIESSFETRYVKELREMAQTLVNFLSEYEGVQLELFDADQYRDRHYVPFVFECFKAWLRGLDWEAIRAKAKERADRVGTLLNCFYQPLISGFVCEFRVCGG